MACSSRSSMTAAFASFVCLFIPDLLPALFISLPGRKRPASLFGRKRPQRLSGDLRLFVGADHQQRHWRAVPVYGAAVSGRAVSGRIHDDAESLQPCGALLPHLGVILADAARENDGV